MRKAHFAGFAMLIALVVVPMCGATTATVSGLVRNSAGTPQIGAEVQLLRPDLTVVATVYTDATGRFKFASLFPGHYSVKAMGMSYLPALRENVRVRTGTIVDLTLNTLYEVMQWLPAQPRVGNSQQDDWEWTLRSAENRPLLRWLEDGPLVVVSDGPGTTPKLKARLMATGQAGTFGESGERFSVSVEDTPADSQELLARVDFAPGTDAGLESMLGFRQDLGFAGSVRSVAAVAVHPEIDGPAGQAGLDEAAVRTWETLHLGDEFEAEVGSTEVVGRFASMATNTVAAALPNASADWRDGNSSVGYRLATFMSGPIQYDDTQAGAWLPEFSIRNGALVLQRAIADGELRQPGTGLGIIVLNRAGHKRRQAVADRRVAIAPVRRGIRQRRGYCIGRHACEASHYFCGTHLSLELIAQVKCLPGANCSLVQSCLPCGAINLRMDGDGCYRSDRASKTQILSESEHGFQSRICARSKIHPRQQFLAVGGRILHRN